MSLESVVKKGHLGSSLSIHPYFGKVDPGLVIALMQKYSKTNDVVLDPFCGSGTVMHEGILHNRSCVGWDSSPLAILIATSKLVGITEGEEYQLRRIKDEFQSILNQIKANQLDIPDFGAFPLMPRVNHIEKWFNDNAIKELKYIKWWIDMMLESADDLIKLLATLAFSKIITRSSNQQSESNYRSVTKPNIPGRVINLFISSIDETISCCKAFNIEKSNCNYVSGRSLNWNKDSSHVTFDNDITLSLSKADSRMATTTTSSMVEADLVITSPPYLMSWDYGLYHKFRFYLLGFDLDAYEETEIGRHLRRKNDDIERYEDDMKNVFKTLSRAVSVNGTICMINSPSSVYGKYVDTNEVLSSCAASQGWQLKEIFSSIELTGPHHGMYASTTARGATVSGQSGKKEHVLIFQRPCS